MNVWVSYHERRDNPSGPRGYGFRENFKGYNEWESPDLGGETNEESLVYFLREPSPEEELEYKDSISWNLVDVSVVCN